MDARPVVKWAGGKSRLVGELARRMPPKMSTYVEPFAGGAALFFALANRRAFDRAILNDKNGELVACYRAIKTNVGALVKRLRTYEKEFLPLAEPARREYYAVVRRDKPRSYVERAARLLFLNKTCFNGLWRVNASGEFNVPFGRYTRPKILDEEALLAASEALQGVEIENEDFEVVTKGLGPDDFVYFDPPYVPLSSTANFTAYARDPFGIDEQKRLADLLVALRKRRVRAMLSNTYSDETKAIYRRPGCTFAEAEMRRGINSDPTKRGPVKELLVMNFEVDKDWWGGTPLPREEAAVAS